MVPLFVTEDTAHQCQRFPFHEEEKQPILFGCPCKVIWVRATFTIYIEHPNLYQWTREVNTCVFVIFEVSGRGVFHGVWRFQYVGCQKAPSIYMPRSPSIQIDQGRCSLYLWKVICDKCFQLCEQCQEYFCLYCSMHNFNKEHRVYCLGCNLEDEGKKH